MGNEGKKSVRTWKPALNEEGFGLGARYLRTHVRKKLGPRRGRDAPEEPHRQSMIANAASLGATESVFLCCPSRRLTPRWERRNDDADGRV